MPLQFYMDPICTYQTMLHTTLKSFFFWVGSWERAQGEVWKVFIVVTIMLQVCLNQAWSQEIFLGRPSCKKNNLWGPYVKIFKIFSKYRGFFYVFSGCAGGLRLAFATLACIYARQKNDEWERDKQSFNHFYVYI